MLNYAIVILSILFLVGYPTLMVLMSVSDTKKSPRFKLDATWECRGATLHYPRKWSIRTKESIPAMQLQPSFSGVAYMQWMGGSNLNVTEIENNLGKLIRGWADHFASVYEGLIEGLAIERDYTINESEFDGRVGAITAIAPLEERRVVRSRERTFRKGYYWYAIYLNGEGHADHYACVFMVLESQYDACSVEIKHIIDSIEVGENLDRDSQIVPEVDKRDIEPMCGQH